MLRFASLAALLSAASATTCHLSNVLGDHMVLQRDGPTPVWGFATAGVSVTTTFNNQKYTTTTNVNGTWVQPLPPTPAGGPYTISFSCSDGASFALNDVLFGDVHIWYVFFLSLFFSFFSFQNILFFTPGSHDASVCVCCLLI